MLAVERQQQNVTLFALFVHLQMMKN